MGLAKVLGDSAWRDYETDGVPSSGAHQPTKSAIRSFIAAVDAETYTAPTIAAGAVTFDLNNGESFKVANTANVTSVTISNAPTGKAFTFDLLLTADGTLRSWTWPASVVWVDGAAPVLTSTVSKRDWIGFKTFDGGTTWFASIIGQGF